MFEVTPFEHMTLSRQGHWMALWIFFARQLKWFATVPQTTALLVEYYNCHNNIVIYKHTHIHGNCNLKNFSSSTHYENIYFLAIQRTYTNKTQSNTHTHILSHVLVSREYFRCPSLWAFDVTIIYFCITTMFACPCI